jgi:hypothetical protein
VAQTGQPYAYTGDNPVNWLDPLGLSWYDPSWAHTAVDRLARGAKKVGHFVSTHKQAVIVAATIVATLPLDLTGAGEAIDAGVIGAEGAADVTADVVADEAGAEQASDEGTNCVVGGESFTPDTEVQLANGAKIPISQVRVGDMVLAADTATGKTQAEPVTTLWVNHDNDLMDVTVKTASGTSTIKSTQHHLFWDLSTHAWVQADDLSAGTELQTPNGATATVVATTIVPGAADMWDLTVNNDHDFYVVVSARSQTSVLVHNCASKAERLGQVFQRLNAGDPASSSSEAFDNLSSTMNAVEDEAGIPAEENPGLTSTERMYPPQADSITSFDDGSMLARIQGGYVNFSANGAIQVVSGDAPMYFVPGTG